MSDTVRPLPPEISDPAVQGRSDAGPRTPEAVTEAARLAARRAAQRWSGKKPQTKVLLPA